MQNVLYPNKIFCPSVWVILIVLLLPVQDKALRACTYSASSSSDAEPEPDYETSDFGTAGEELGDLTKNKQGNWKCNTW